MFILIALSAVSALRLQHVTDLNAVCLDGTLASYYFDEGFDEGVNKYIVHFEGGGWIQGDTYDLMMQYAIDRMNTPVGSSKFQAQEKKVDGIFTREIWNEFYNWNQIYLNYCDGTGFQGYAAQPYKFNGKSIYIRGETIFKSIFRTFYSRFKQADAILVSGFSAGGLAAFTWIQFIRDNLPPSVRVVGVPDSSVFLDFASFDGSISARERRQQQYMKVANVEVDPPNAQCVKANPGAKWKCLFAEYLMSYISVPLFIINSWYDTACIYNILKIPCVNDYSLHQCSSEQLNYIEKHHEFMLSTINAKLQQDPFSGSFNPSCLQHGFMEFTRYNLNSWTVPGLSQYTIAKSLTDWYNKKGSNIHQDTVNWPNNQQCSAHG